MIVDIDEKSLRSLGHWPWPRTQIGEMVEKITEAGAIAIGFDAIFAEPDRMSPATLALGAPQLDLETRAALARMPTNDEMFARSIRRSRVVLGQSGVRDDARRASEGPATPISTASAKSGSRSSRTTPCRSNSPACCCWPRSLAP